MPKVHRHNDSRVCGARTIVVGQSSVYVNGRLASVKDDPNTHGNGELIPSVQSVRINGKQIIVLAPDLAKIDGLLHVGALDATASASGDVSAGG